MIEVVLVFGLINVLFEFVLLSMLSPRIRLRVLGSGPLRLAMHIGFLITNLFLHWGTVVGTTSAVLAFISSMVTVKLARWLYGYITDGRSYTTGFIRYSAKELK